jgi:hypothetical protein
MSLSFAGLPLRRIFVCVLTMNVSFSLSRLSKTLTATFFGAKRATNLRFVIQDSSHQESQQ